MIKENYILEYWIDLNAFSEKDLDQKVSIELKKLDVDFQIRKERDYHILIITADKKNIDACHHHLNFDREEAFRAKDELGDELRSKAYPVLAEIETWLRRFITRAMMEVLGFNWWNRTTPKNIKKNVDEVERKAGAKQAQEHHQIEFTMFGDLIELVTGKYQKWSDTKNLTPSDLAELLDDCEIIEEIKHEVSKRRKQTSLWEDVFSNYFDDKKAWRNLESKIDGIVIPIRNKVMHHRLIRIHDVRRLKESRDELLRIIGKAKSELPLADLNKALESLRTFVKNAHYQISQNALNQFVIDPKVIERIKNSAQIDPEIIKAITQTPLIDPEIMRKFTSGINFRLEGFDNKSIPGESNEEDPNDDEKSNQNQKGKSNDNERNDSSDDGINGENDKS